MGDGVSYCNLSQSVFRLIWLPRCSKQPTQTPKLLTIQKLILSFFHNVIQLIDQLSANETLVLAVNESAKLLPYVMNSRKAVKSYLKVGVTFSLLPVACCKLPSAHRLA